MREVLCLLRLTDAFFFPVLCSQRGTPICGEVYISHQSLNTASGFITSIDYATGELRVGGTAAAVGADGVSVDARVRLNDPATDDGQGRFGRPNPTTSDRRFQVDQDNPTVTSASSFPMCIPRSDPAVADDPLCQPHKAQSSATAGARRQHFSASIQCVPPVLSVCVLGPRGNRPVDATGLPLQFFEMSDPRTTPAGSLPDPFRQAPLLVGDFITYAGTLTREVTDAATGAGFDYISAHTVTSNTAIFTAPGSVPSYVNVEVTLLGVGGITSADAEATVRSRFEGSCTDASAIIHLYGVDFDPVSGDASDRDWGRVGGQ
jgi:hypothetical protein